LGVHPVFGAFLFGACLPRDDRLLHSLIGRIEHVAALVLMPVFFALAGINTSTDAFVGAGLGSLLLILARAV
jgi:K+:H+ antiporter